MREYNPKDIPEGLISNQDISALLLSYFGSHSDINHIFANIDEIKRRIAFKQCSSLEPYVSDSLNAHSVEKLSKALECDNFKQAVHAALGILTEGHEALLALLEYVASPADDLVSEIDWNDFALEIGDAHNFVKYAAKTTGYPMSVIDEAVEAKLSVRFDENRDGCFDRDKLKEKQASDEVFEQSGFLPFNRSLDL
jgi:hypothetical protein